MKTYNATIYFSLPDDAELTEKEIEHTIHSFMTFFAGIEGISVNIMGIEFKSPYYGSGGGGGNFGVNSAGGFVAGGSGGGSGIVQQSISKRQHAAAFQQQIDQLIKKRP